MKAHVFALCLSLSLCLGLPLPRWPLPAPSLMCRRPPPTMMPFCGPQKPASPTAPQRPPSPPMRPVPGPSWPVFLWRAAGEPKPALAEQQFMDVTDPSAYYYGAVQWLQRRICGDSGPLRPMRCVPGWTRYSSCGARRQPDMEGEFPFADVPFGDGDGHGQPSTGTLTRRCCGRWRTVSPAVPRRPHSPRTLPVPGVRSPHSLYRAAQAETSAK